LYIKEGWFLPLLFVFLDVCLFTNRMVLNLDNPTNFIFTLNEKETSAWAYWYFQFTNVVTKQVITVVKLRSTDLSPYPNRYNEFPYAFFNALTIGQWNYLVFGSNSAVATTGEELEVGLVRVIDNDTVFTTNETLNTYVVYG